MAGASEHPSLYTNKANNLLDVFPVSGIQTPGKYGEHAEEQQHDYAQLETVFTHRFSHENQEAGKVGHGLIVLYSSHCARLGLLKANKGMGHFGWIMRISLFFVLGNALALKLPQHVGHAHIRERHVVPACGLGWIAVVSAQVGVDVVSARAI